MNRSCLAAIISLSMNPCIYGQSIHAGIRQDAMSIYSESYKFDSLKGGQPYNLNSTGINMDLILGTDDETNHYFIRFYSGLNITSTKLEYRSNTSTGDLISSKASEEENQYRGSIIAGRHFNSQQFRIRAGCGISYSYKSPYTFQSEDIYTNPITGIYMTGKKSIILPPAHIPGITMIMSADYKIFNGLCAGIELSSGFNYRYSNGFNSTEEIYSDNTGKTISKLSVKDKYIRKGIEFGGIRPSLTIYYMFNRRISSEIKT